MIIYCSNGRSCTVNTVLWNTIQLLFPQEVEAKKVAAGALNNNRQAQCLSPETAFYSNLRNRSTQQQQYGASSRVMSTSRRNEAENDAALARRLLQREIDGQGQSQHGTTTRRTTRGSSYSRNQEAATSGVRVRTRRGVSSQDEDAALALRLQREEFMQAFRSGQDQSSISSSSLARANLRAMASRAMNLRTLRDRRI